MPLRFTFVQRKVFAWIFRNGFWKKVFSITKKNVISSATSSGLKRMPQRTFSQSGCSIHSPYRSFVLRLVLLFSVALSLSLYLFSCVDVSAAYFECFFAERVYFFLVDSEHLWWVYKSSLWYGFFLLSTDFLWKSVNSLQENQHWNDYKKPRNS